MDKNSDNPHSRKWMLWSGIYAAAIIITAGSLNFFVPYSAEPVKNPPAWVLLFWSLLYLPVIFLPLLARQKVSSMGFNLNIYMAIASILAVGICTPMIAGKQVSWNSAIFEAFARTGEEVFFRGFLFFLLAHLFKQRLRPWLWAALLSSLLFALVHTQTFQPGYLLEYGSPVMPAWYQILERLVNVFLIALALALLRAWTGSVLPGALAHSLSGGGILTLPFVFLIYLSFAGWAWLRGEPVMEAIQTRNNTNSKQISQSDE